MTIKLLKPYTTAVESLEEFKEQNKKIFEQYETLQIAVSDADKVLKEEMRQALAQGVTVAENDRFVVKASQAFRRFYDYALLVKKARPAELRAAEKAIDHSVNYEAFKELVGKGMIPVELEREIYVEEALTPRITIKEKDNDQE